MEGASYAMMEADGATMRPLTLAAAILRNTPSDGFVEYAMVDAFTDRAFKGNPAAVVLLPQAEDEKWMQQVAAEFNVSQTAFLVRKKSYFFQGAGRGEGVEDVHHLQANESKGHLEPNSTDDEYHIRWFTRSCEVPLCGHATLASSHVLFTAGLVTGDTIFFHSKSGKLIVRKVEPSVAEEENGAPHKGGGNLRHLLELNFPMTTMVACDKSEIQALSTTLKGVDVVSVGRTAKDDDLIVELSSTEAVRNLQPQVHELLQCSGRGLHVTARDSSDSSIDFVSRCFFPRMGVNEDPVCGSAHCALTPYWAAKLGKDSLEAYQGLKRFYSEIASCANKKLGVQKLVKRPLDTALEATRPRVSFQKVYYVLEYLEYSFQVQYFTGPGTDEYHGILLRENPPFSSLGVAHQCYPKTDLFLV